MVTNLHIALNTYINKLGLKSEDFKPLQING